MATEKEMILAWIQQRIDAYATLLQQEHPRYRRYRDDYLRGMEDIQAVVENYYAELDELDHET